MSCHASEEALERYCLGSCDEQELAALEEHLLVCHVCQDRVLEADSLLRPMRAALAEKSGQGRAAAGGSHRSHRRWWGLFQTRLLWFPILGLVLLLFVFWPPFRASSSAPQVVALATFRGLDASPAHAPHSTALKLQPDLSGLAGSPRYRIEVVAPDGSIRRRGVLEENGDFTAGMLARGYYWVRLYDQTGKLLREYALEVG